MLICTSNGTFRDLLMTKNVPSSLDSELILLSTIKDLIIRVKENVVLNANIELVLLNWTIGKLIKSQILMEQRSEYGEKIVATLSQQLSKEFGRGFTQSALFRMIKFYELFPDNEIVATLSPQLGWSHFVELIPITDPLKREFYAELCRAERWNVRVLRDKIRGMLYERTAISKKPELTIKNDLEALRKTGKPTKELVLRDPYLLEFLGLEDTYSESDLEKAILKDLEKFLLELGNDFAFIARQKRITIGGEDFYIDLLLFHRSLRRLVLIELKLGKFQAAHKGQVELYLRWLDKHERKEGEESPLGIILCAEKHHEQIELLELGTGDIDVAEYLTKPLENILKKRLQIAVEKARDQGAR
jgi:predicted nuclease of restriction endonuclease-like (RecB) superfamily